MLTYQVPELAGGQKNMQSAQLSSQRQATAISCLIYSANSTLLLVKWTDQGNY